MFFMAAVYLMMYSPTEMFLQAFMCFIVIHLYVLDVALYIILDRVWTPELLTWVSQYTSINYNCDISKLLLLL